MGIATSVCLQARSANSLKCSARNQGQHVVREAAAEREGEEDDEGGDESISSANNIGDASEEDGAAQEG